MSKEAMKLALEALEWCHGGEPCGTAEAITALRDALAEQPAQKRPQNCGTSYCSCIECVMEPAQQEHVAYQDTADKCRLETVPAKGGLLPQRTWVGLSTEDKATCIDEPSWDLILRKAEEILKGKNT